MKKLLLVCSLVVLIASACRKDSSDDYAAQQAVVDDEQIRAYLDANKIVATKDPSGVYYAVLIAGSGAYPTTSSTVSVNYTVGFTDGTIFGTGNLTTAVNGNIIEGWKIGLTKINKDGRLLLAIPSALAYGPEGKGTIPANKVLIYTIDMLSIK